MKHLAAAPTASDFGSDLNRTIQTLGLSIDAAQRQQLLAYLALLGKWNAAYNLTAVRDPREQLVLHLFDCLAILPALAKYWVPGAVVVDVGSGGGLPGAIIAICHPEVQVHTVDAVGKKAAFVTQVRAALGLSNLHAHHARVEALACGRDLPAADLIISRAFASLTDFVRLTAHLRAPHGVWAAMKGLVPTEELAHLPSAVAVDATYPLAVPQLDAQRHLLILSARAA